MTEEQKEDLQFWLYTKIFVDRVGPVDAMAFGAAEVGVGLADAFSYLQADGRVSGTASSFALKDFDRDEADPKGVYVDIEWMLQILHRAGLRDQTLWKALGSIYKIPATLARQEAEQIPIVEGDD
jgi:hypothetical protein